MMTIGGVTLPPVLTLIGVVLVAFLAIGLFRFFLRLAWRLVGIALMLVIGVGILLFLMNAIQIK